MSDDILFEGSWSRKRACLAAVHNLTPKPFVHRRSCIRGCQQPEFFPVNPFARPSLRAHTLFHFPSFLCKTQDKPTASSGMLSLSDSDWRKFREMANCKKTLAIVIKLPSRPPQRPSVRTVLPTPTLPCEERGRIRSTDKLSNSSTERMYSCRSNLEITILLRCIRLPTPLACACS
jgi:hypothetical protein